MTMRSFLLRNSKKLFSISLILSALNSFGQTNQILEEYRAKYPGHHIVLKENSYTVSIQMVKGVPQVVHHVHTEHLILDQNGLLSLSEEFIEHSSFEELEINEAYVMVPTEKGSKKIPVTQISTQDAEADGAIFHDDTKETSLIFPRMELGALRVLDYTIVMTEFKFPFGFNFASYFPVEKANFEISCDTSVHPVTKMFNQNDLKIDFTDVTVKNKRTMRWTVSNPPTFKLEDNSPNRRYYLPHLMAQIGYYSSKTGRVDVVNDVEDLHRWYYTNIKEVINETPSEELKMISDSITRNIDNEFDKVRAVYYWVQNNIKYIAFEEGINGFVPRQPSAIIKKRYGDCKDMASLIYSMLKSIGITSYLTWVGSRDLPYKYSEFPSSSCDNHMITTYKYNGKTYFLDATNSFLPIDGVASFTLGKEVLVNIDENNFEVLQMNVPDPAYSFLMDTTYISIEGRKLVGDCQAIIGGYYQQMIQPILMSYPKDKVDKAIGSITEKGNNSFKVLDGEIINLTDREKPTELIFDFEVDNYVTALDNEIYVNMVIERDISFGEIKKNRTSPFEFEFKSSDNYTVILEVPEGYKIKTIPENKSYKSDVVDFSVTYKADGDEVMMTLLLDIKTLMIQPKDFAAWNAYISASKNAMSQSLVLIKIN